jgi:molybdopterin synthase sulfur carrier subunit
VGIIVLLAFPAYRSRFSHFPLTLYGDMPTVSFTPNIQRHVSCPPTGVEGDTVREALEAVFQGNPRARTYVLDDQGAVRPHMVVFVDGRQVQDRRHLSDRVTSNAEIYVAQALSGG